MTAADSHAISPGFVWKDEYQETLEHIADTDEVDQDIDWPPLKDAIKHKITQALALFPATPPPTLHPAAALIPLMQQSADGHLLTETSYTTSSSADSLASFPLNDSVSGAAAAAGPSASTEESNTMTPSASAAESLSNRFAPEGSAPDPQPEAFALAHGVSPADAQGFFASKSQPPASMGSSWGRMLSEEELEREKALVFGMLDEFDTQPPFTIQRLAELATRPTELQKTRSKYLNALQRVLSVTATRDAFPIDHSTPEPMASGLPDMAAPAIPAPTGAIDEVSHLPNGTFAIAGMGTARPRSQSVSSNSSTASARSQEAVDRHIEPLFSPIPFLIRDAGEEEGEKGVQAAVKEALEEVPDLELGGADRTHLQPGVAIIDTDLVAAAPRLGQGESSAAEAAAAASQSQTAASTTEPPSKPDAAPPTTAHAHPPPLTTSTSPPSPAAALGVPPGRVDELDLPPSSSSSSSSGLATVPISATADGEGTGTGTEQRKMETTPTPLSATTHLPESSAGEGEGEKRDQKRQKQDTLSDKAESMDVDPDPPAGASSAAEGRGTEA